MKEFFPLFDNYPELVYLDSAATTQKPLVCLRAINEFYTLYNANVHRGIHFLGNKATHAIEESKNNIAKFLNCFGENIIFLSGATDAINYAASLIKEDLKEGDEIVITQLEHHANVIPWQQLIQEKGIKLIWAEVDQNGVLDIENVLNKINHRTKLIAITHLSNVTGQITDIATTIEQAHKNGVKVLIDGAQAVSKVKINLTELNPDFYVFSSHKLYSSTGLGVLYMASDYLNRAPTRFGGGTVIDVSENHTEWLEGSARHQPGTPAMAEIFALGETIKWLNGIEYVQHEINLHQKMLNMLKGFKELKIIGQSDSGVISFIIDDINPQDVNALLDEQKIAIRTGSHCALPFMHKLDLKAGTNRVSLGLYNNENDIKKLHQAIKKTIRILK